MYPPCVDCLTRRSIEFLALAVAAILWHPPTTRGASDLNQEMAKVAAQIKLLLDEKGQNAIAVGDFRGPAKLVSSAGPGITKALGDALTKCAVTVNRRAELEVNGDYRDVEDQKTRQMAVQIKAHVVDRSGNEVAAFEPRGILNEATIAALIGVTVTMPAAATDQERDNKLSDAIDKPKVHLATTRISADAASPYAIEILVQAGTDFRPRAASRDSDGFAFMKIRHDEIYSVRLINDALYDAAVTLTIDGLGVFAFSETSSYTHWVVPSKKALTVRGWHRTNKLSDSFQITDYAKSAVAAKLPSSASVGTITAAFFAAWPKGSTPPEDEASGRKGAPAGDATGRGPAVATNFTEVVRDVGRLRAAISVRYTKDDDPKNLPDSRP